jgi:hypothetical protein
LLHSHVTAAADALSTNNGSFTELCRHNQFVRQTASEASGENQNKQDDDQDANYAHSAMPEAVAVSTKAAAEAPEEKNDENDEKNGTERHDISSSGMFLPIC